MQAEEAKKKAEETYRLTPTADRGLIRFTSRRGVSLLLRRVRESERNTIDAAVCQRTADGSTAAKKKHFELVVRAAIVEAENLKDDEGQPVVIGKRGTDPVFAMVGPMAGPEVYDALDNEEAVDVYKLAVAGITAAQAKN